MKLKLHEIPDEKTPFDDARKFLDYLRLSQPHWEHSENDKNVRWFFRGMSQPLDENGNERWGLLPTAWRHNSKGNDLHRQMDSSIYRNKDDNGTSEDIRRLQMHTDKDKAQNAQNLVEQVYAEYCVLKQFVELANANAVYLPELSMWRELTRNFLKTYCNNIICGKEKENSKLWLHPIVALAQHHGIPTRLLDWTQNPLAAAYFAVSSYRDSSETEQKATKYITIYAFHDWMIDSPNNDFIKKADVAYADNQYAHHQQGRLFLIERANRSYSADKYFIQHGRFPTFHDAIVNMGEETTEDVKMSYRKISLAKFQINELERLLFLEGMTLAHLMPSLDNVAKTVKNRFGIR